MGNIFVDFVVFWSLCTKILPTNSWATNIIWSMCGQILTTKSLASWKTRKNFPLENYPIYGTSCSKCCLHHPQLSGHLVQIFGQWQMTTCSFYLQYRRVLMMINYSCLYYLNHTLWDTLPVVCACDLCVWFGIPLVFQCCQQCSLVVLQWVVLLYSVIADGVCVCVSQVHCCLINKNSDWTLPSNCGCISQFLVPFDYHVIQLS